MLDPERNTLAEEQLRTTPGTLLGLFARPALISIDVYEFGRVGLQARQGLCVCPFLAMVDFKALGDCTEDLPANQ